MLMRIISISGLDGSGKSTQINLLKTYLESQGRKVFYFHAIQFGIAKKLLEFKNKYCLLCKLTGQREPTSPEKSVTKANFLQIFGRRIFLFIDLLRFKLLRNKLRSREYAYILSDRYFYDSVINIKYLAQNEKNLPCEKFIFKPDLAIYLDANPEIIMQRERKPDQDLEYLKIKASLYSNTSNKWNPVTVDGNRNKEEIFKEIKKEISKFE